MSTGVVLSTGRQAGRWAGWLAGRQARLAGRWAGREAGLVGRLVGKQAGRQGSLANCMVLEYLIGSMVLNLFVPKKKFKDDGCSDLKLQTDLITDRSINNKKGNLSTRCNSSTGRTTRLVCEVYYHADVVGPKLTTSYKEKQTGRDG
ncbi:hypothetical protein PPACK8108_LOCUS2016 [Phakopsora pachyrhizi]|uniref:Uncharacterized protein n=1 Tax=Phakopsora pachyrhizi TaxID=170000 RepID=A0AAV0AIJ3_PHAPC|nr:hypothetical protein PPACK8108_LOCUS2016 [Phakopsora pachyrhizi]